MRLDPLVNPRSVAIVGATDRGGPGRAVMESLGAIGFTGADLSGESEIPDGAEHHLLSEPDRFAARRPTSSCSRSAIR